MIKVKTELNQIITFEEKDGILVASMELQIVPVKESYYQEMLNIMQVLKLDIPINVRSILEQKLDDYKDLLVDGLVDYCTRHIINSYTDIIEE